MSPIFEDFGTIDSTAFFHRSDVHNIEIDEKEKIITWFFRVGAEVEVNCKKWIVNDDRAQKLRNISTMKTFKQCVLHFRNLTKWQRQSFEFIIQNTSFFFEKGEGG
jgi:hypothetical protein